MATTPTRPIPTPMPASAPVDKPEFRGAGVPLLLVLGAKDVEVGEELVEVIVMSCDVGEKPVSGI